MHYRKLSRTFWTSGGMRFVDRALIRLTDKALYSRDKVLEVKMTKPCENTQQND